MADYHGDVMFRVGNVYQSRDDRNYYVAIILLLFLGAMGVHRFYLNDQKIAWCYFGTFALAIFATVAAFDLTFILWQLGIASVFLVIELFWFIFKIATRG